MGSAVPRVAPAAVTFLGACARISPGEANQEVNMNRR